MFCRMFYGVYVLVVATMETEVKEPRLIKYRTHRFIGFFALLWYNVLALTVSNWREYREDCEKIAVAIFPKRFHSAFFISSFLSLFYVCVCVLTSAVCSVQLHLLSIVYTFSYILYWLLIVPVWILHFFLSHLCSKSQDTLFKRLFYCPTNPIWGTFSFCNICPLSLFVI